MITVGLDMGAKNIKVIILDGEKSLLRGMAEAEIDRSEAAETLISKSLKGVGIEKRDVKIGVTGSGKKAIEFADKDATVITTDALGMAKLNPSVVTMIDIGAEESLGIQVDSSGHVKNSAVNEKCAAGSGAFVEAMARAMQVSLEDFAKFSLESDKAIPMNAQCAVFAESEVVSLVHEGIDRVDICRSVHDAIAARIVSMVRRIGIEEDIGIVGGGALNKGLLASLKREIGGDVELYVPEYPQYVAALGAAILARS